MHATKLLRHFLALMLSIGTLAALSLHAAGQAPRTDAVTLFEGARLIVGDGRAPIENSAFIVDNNRFARIGRKGELQLPNGAVRVDLTGKTVMPALIETHSHVGWVNQRTGSNAPQTRENFADHLQRYAYYGFAAVMSLGRDPGELAFQVRAEPIPGAPLFRTAGRGFETPDRGGPAGRSEAPYAVTTEAEARKDVQELAAKKVDMVKMWVDDRGGKVRKLSPELYRAIIDEAHKHNLRVVAHIFGLEDAKDLLRSGVDGFAHSVQDKDIDDEFITLVKQRNAFIDPNLPARGVAEDLTWVSDTVRPEEIKRLSDAAAKQTPEALQRMRERFAITARNLVKAQAAGLLIGLGTDQTGEAWPALVEMADMVAAGLTPAQVIVIATRNSAQIMRLDQLGTVAAGKSADFIVLNANPLDDITNTRRIARVYLRGQEVDRAALRSAWTGRASQ
jgi:imidazolonepropionase-like amidohydrolase